MEGSPVEMDVHKQRAEVNVIASAVEVPPRPGIVGRDEGCGRTRGVLNVWTAFVLVCFLVFLWEYATYIFVSYVQV